MKKTALLLISILFLSCTEDSPNQDPQEVVMTSYRFQLETIPETPEYNSVWTGNLVNNKRFSETYELFHNGVIEIQETVQTHFYNADGTLNHHISLANGRTTNLYYDGSGNLVGATLFNNENEVIKSVRFIHISDTEVYYEILDLPYDDPNAAAWRRTIIHFNENDEVISAGKDNNFDGVMEDVNTFEYANDNLTAIHYYNGVNESYQYSTIVDNFRVLDENTFGKRNLAILCGESFGYGSPYQNINSSRHILQSVSEEATYQVLPNNFYELKTLISDDFVETAQFFFE